MENYKKVQVVMLATEKESRLHYNEQRKIIITTNSDMKHPMDKPQHLYFLTDEEIKEGDWLLDLRTNKIAKNINNSIICFNPSIKKIIATTNPELTNIALEYHDRKRLPIFLIWE